MRPERWFYTIPLRVRALLLRRRLDADLDEELQAHLEEKTQEYIDSGLDPEEAHYAALREFGNVELSKQNCRDARRVLWAQNFFDDVRFAVRILLKDPGFTIVAVLTLALGIGANTAIFSVINAVLFRPLPYRQPERLVFLAESAPDMPGMFISLANLKDWQAMNHAFEGMGGFRRVSATLTGQGEPRRLLLGQVTSGLFPTIGVEPLVGHMISPEEDKADAAPVVLLSDKLWTNEFGRDPRVLGRQMRLDGTWYTITGVVPNSRLPLYWRQVEAFASLGRLESSIGGERHRSHHLGVYAYARLKPGVTLEQARADMQRIASELARRHPKTNAGQSALVQPLLEKVVGDVSRPLALLMGAVGLVLLIACANVASLLTSRAIVRRREIAIRSALGAGTGRLLAQLLCESTLLALVGGALGLLLAYGITPLLAHQATAIVPRIEDISIDSPVLLFTLAISLATGVVFGVVPALAACRSNPAESFQETGRVRGSGFLPRGLRSALATAELAMALVLLVAAGLTMKSLFRVLAADPGMQSRGVLTGVLNLPSTKYPGDAQQDLFMRRLLPRLAALPEVAAAGFQTPALVGGSQGTFRVEGGPQPPPGQQTYAQFSSLTPGGLEALGVKLVAGRFFTWQDGANAPLVCIIDDTLADQYWPGENPIGKRVATEVPVNPTWWTVVGVVHHMTTDAADPQQLPEIFLAFSQFADGRGRLIFHARDGQPSPLPGVMRTIHSVDPDLPLYDVRSLSDLMSEKVATRRLLVVLLSVFAGIALLLAMLGVYGVMAYMVAGRTGEIGVRLALGAKPRHIVRLILGQVVPVVLLGAAIGVVGSLVLKLPLNTLLFQVSSSDPWTIAAVAGLLIAVALAACCVPLKRALGIDPVEVLRRE